jgi:DNA-binding FadR family transcriptional regulator
MITAVKKSAGPVQRGLPVSFPSEQISAARTLADRVTESLMEKITAGQIPGGARLPSEQMMAATFGVSRTVIREAVSRLKSEGLIDSRQGRGAIVRVDRGDVPLRLGIDNSDPLKAVLQIAELRVGLDGEIAALAAQRRRRDQMAAIYRALHNIDRANRAGEDAIAEDLEFHISIARATGNPLFPDLTQHLGDIFSSTMGLTRANERRHEKLFEQTRKEHQAIAKAIEERNSAAASLAARNHLLNAAERFRAAGPDFWKARGFEIEPKAAPR